jgi:hypothetical protein
MLEYVRKLKSIKLQVGGSSKFFYSSIFFFGIFILVYLPKFIFKFFIFYFIERKIYFFASLQGYLKEALETFVFFFKDFCHELFYNCL